ncbi:hypothetical protein [Acinetobacter sp. MD2(2019)]|uniref:hypothetical protein n=1 Tax=Acinetobacter sp. MD2(2019) TaxID=2605273 RepID=UPI002D1E9C42|nr:hypothetical protein [Acinetobacter sp. MD2(2019)]MEB3755174.1 hypothetical protein [Acinetobacter sp. MD2(2019)]
MSNPTFDHEIYRIAHPVMQTLVKQAVKAREFQTNFPNLYRELKIIKTVLLQRLMDLLTEKYNQKISLPAEKIKEEVITIVSGRQLLKKVIAYCQVKELYDEDIFLLGHLLNPNELKDIFNELHGIFWEHISRYERNTKLSDFSTKFKEILDKEHCLADLLPCWDIKQLFLDYCKIYIEYHQFNNNKNIKGTNIDQKPTFEEAKAVVNRLNLYDTPLQGSKKSFIEQQGLDGTSKTINLHLNLEEDPENLPALLNKFIYKFMTTRLDVSRNGTDASSKIDNEVVKKIHSLSTTLDEWTNSIEVLKRADAILTALISLIYYDKIFETQIMNGNPHKFEEANYYELTINEISRLENQPFMLNAIDRDRRDSVNFTGMDYLSDLFQTMYELFENDNELKILPSPNSEKFISCGMDGKLYEHTFSKESLSKSLKAMLKKLSPDHLHKIISL